MSQIQSLTERIVAFRDERDWQQFHNPKDLALSLVLEAGEVMELFQWQNGEAIEQAAREKHGALADELADVLYYTLLLAHERGIDLEQALLTKLQRNEEKYPVDKARGSSRKCTAL